MDIFMAHLSEKMAYMALQYRQRNHPFAGSKQFIHNGELVQGSITGWEMNIMVIKKEMEKEDIKKEWEKIAE